MRALLRRSEFCRGLVSAGRQLPSDLQKLKGSVGRRTVIRRYLTEHRTRKMQIGTGPNELPGWLNTDFAPRTASIVYLDATKPFPLPNASFDFIFSEHMIEHVTFEQGLRMLTECGRVLLSGGVIRIATPNLERIAALETCRPSADQERYVTWAIDNHVPFALEPRHSTAPYRPSYVINNFFWGFGHYFVYDPSTLADALKASGFSDVTSFEPGKSNLPELSGLEHHATIIGDEFNQFETMVLQATKR
jgi:SAM-dependent methyltransferase